jgi:hypothetical protein
MIPRSEFRKRSVSRGRVSGIYFANQFGVFFGSSDVEPVKVSRLEDVLCLEFLGKTLVAGTESGKIVSVRKNQILDSRKGPVHRLVVGDRLYDVSDFGGDFLISATGDDSVPCWLSNTPYVFWDGEKLVKLGKNYLRTFEGKKVKDFEDPVDTVVFFNGILCPVRNGKLVSYTGEVLAPIPEDAEGVIYNDNLFYFTRGRVGLWCASAESEPSAVFPEHLVSCFVPGTYRLARLL